MAYAETRRLFVGTVQMAKQPGKPTVNLIDPTLLSDEEKVLLQQKAKERVAKERKDAAMDAFLKSAIDTERRAGDPDAEIKYITLDMAGHADRVMLDGVVYFHGQTYAVPKPVYDVLADTVARGWEHEDEIGGSNRAFYRRPSGVALRPGMEGMTNTQLLGRRV